MVAEHHEEDPAALAVAVVAHPVDVVGLLDAVDREEGLAVEEAVVVSQEADVVVVAALVVDVVEEATRCLRTGTVSIGNDESGWNSVFVAVSFRSYDTYRYHDYGVWVLGKVFLFNSNLWRHITGILRRVRCRRFLLNQF